MNVAVEAGAMEATDAGAMVPATPFSRTEESTTFWAASRPALATTTVANRLFASRVMADVVNIWTDVVGA